MAVIDRRQFCSLLGAALAGVPAFAAVACSSGGEAKPGSDPVSVGVLSGVSFAVRRDPG